MRDTLKMAREAGNGELFGAMQVAFLERLVALVRADERSAPVQEPESFEQWNAKQHGDPEEIGFLQALRIAYCAGQDSVTKATPPAPVQEQPSEAIVQTFTGLPMRKLRDLLTAGYRVNGVSFERTQGDGTVLRGAATTGGMVLWWNQTPVPLTDEQCRAAFDAWYSSAPDAPEEPERIYELTDESMSELTKECIWLGWQAAHGITEKGQP